MKPTTKLFLRTFLMTGIPYGTIMTLFDLYTRDDLQPWKLVSQGFIFGFLMALISTNQYKKQLKKNGGHPVSDDDLLVMHKKRFTSGITLSQLEEKLKADPVTGKMKITETEKGILLRSGMSWKSWGEKITIVPIAENGTETEYEVTSKPRVVTTIMDYGKNLENVTRIQRLLQGAA